LPCSKSWLRFAEIVDEHVLDCTHGLTVDDFVADQKAADATERCVLRITEAAVSSTSSLKNAAAAYLARNPQDWKLRSHWFSHDRRHRHHDFGPLLADLRKLIATHDTAEK
jgi:hypothetical protein